ncbi:hypothetical protein [Caulobacter sp. S45]|uniref:hypothetical protein n=1 Tax=Caulobacter sp. S45 TaxID=1641861 RepID=UPI0015756330|nr:hypothetical protein [Caulobacter sp. S45]
MSAALTMHEAAAETGLAYRTFRREWPRMVAELGFPAPLLGRRWSADAVAAWKARRSAGLPTVGPEPDASPERVLARRAATARDQLEQLRAA